MAKTLADAANSHSYPKIYQQLPMLLRLQHWLMKATTLRNWYVLAELKKRLRRHGPAYRLLDAGCGAGDMILPWVRRHKRASFVGIDSDPENVQICQLFADRHGHAEAAFEPGLIEEYVADTPVDVIVCVGVLQYVKQDERTLRNFHASLADKGELLLYSPVTHRRIFRWFDRLRKQQFNDLDYDEAQGIVRHYSSEELMEKLKRAGFRIEKRIYANSTPGRLAYELQTATYYLTQRLPFWLFPLAVVGYALLLYPFVFSLMIVDYQRENSEGNGILIVARKRDADQHRNPVLL